MKEVSRILKGRYCAVNANEEEQQCHLSFGNNTENSCTGNQKQMTMHRTVPADKQRRKSLNANRSMHPARVISSFFNDRQNNGRARAPKCAFLLLAIGVLAITTAVLVKIFQPYELIFKWKLVMEKEGEIFELWEKPPVDLYIKIYLFNITNAEAFLKGKEKLNVQQVGPYVYKEIMTHENVTFNANNTMSTIPSHPLVWQEHLSEGNKEDDELIMVDIALLSAVHTANKNYLTRLGIRFLGSEPIKRMTAKQFMFGFPSHLTSLGNTLFGNKIPFDAVGLIDRMYDFRGDYETFHTGVPNPAISGLYSTYRGEPNLPNWPNGEHCSNIELASDGTKFKSFIQPNETLKFFRKSMCRPINLYRTGEIEKHGSLSGYKYVFEENALDNGAINEKNKCFCREGRCQPQGLLDVSDCYYTFPISLSYPHFMDGEPGLRSNVTGLTPNKDLHSSTFVIQPESGLPLSIGVRMQINMHFNDMPRNHESRYFKDLTVPMLWFDIMMPKLTDELDTRFNMYINYLPYLDILGFWGGLFLGIALVAYAVLRATISMSTYVETRNYTKSNLFHCGNNVYQPCEMKLLSTNEKPDSLMIARSIPNISSEKNDSCDILYTEINMKNRPLSVYALEMEPVLSDDSSDEGNDSDTVTLSRHSTSSSNMDVNSDEYDSSGRSTSNDCTNAGQMSSHDSSDCILISTKFQTPVDENAIKSSGSTEQSPPTSVCTKGSNTTKDERLPV